MQEQVAKEVAQQLLAIGAVQFRFDTPYQWSSGWYSPIYCDSRLTLSYPKLRTFIKNQFKQVAQEKFPKVEVIAGVATAGISQGTLLADALGLPFVYVRAKKKSHGKGNLIEGFIKEGQQAILVEDVLSTGGSAIQAAQALREAGANVLGVLAIFTYHFNQMQEQMQTANLPFHTLSNYTTLLAEFAKQEEIAEEMMASLHEWRKNPEVWGKS